MNNNNIAADAKLKIGIDIHGVLDAHPLFFQTLTKLLVENGHEVHVLTGSTKEREIEVLRNLGISFTHLFSITDHHVEQNAEVTWDEQGNPHLNPYLWDKTKAEYCKKHDIQLHFDDSDVYNYFFKTPYARFYSKDTHRAKKTHL